jgi:uncharacterized protein (TIGR03083 family)
VVLPRDDVAKGFTEELIRFEELIRSLDDREWEGSSRCEGWRVADIAAHVTGTLADITTGRFDGLGTPEGTARAVDQRRGRTPGEIADELRGVAKLGADILAAIDETGWNGPAPGGLAGTTGEGVEALWYDAYLHGEDIRAAIGRPSTISDGLRASLSHVATILERDGWGPATLAFPPYGEFTVNGGGEGAAAVGGRRIDGDALEFVLAATGRSDPAALGLDDTVNIYR